MKRALVLIGMLLVATVHAQDLVIEGKNKGLKGVNTVAVVVRPNTPREVVPMGELFNMVRVRLHRDLPDLKLSDTAENTPTWLELNIVTTDTGGSLELSLHRWVKVTDTGDEIFTKVWWDSRHIFGGISKASLKDALDSLLTKFAADRLRAGR